MIPIKKTTCVFLGLFILIGSAFTQEINLEFDQSSNSYKITTKNDLVWIREQTNSGLNDFKNINFKIISYNMDLAGENWTPIGTKENPFRGNIDGNGRMIHNITLNSDIQYAGLFGYIEEGIIKNIKIVSYAYNKTSHPQGYLGLLAGYSNSTIINCGIQSNNGSQWNHSLHSNYCAGGLIGKSDGNIYNCYSSHPYIYGHQYSGGIVGISNGIIQDCISNITTIEGQLAGHILASPLDNCSLEQNYRMSSNNSSSNNHNDKDGGIISNTITYYNYLNNNLSKYIYFHPLTQWNSEGPVYNTTTDDSSENQFTNNGLGVSNDPFLISNSTQLSQLADFINTQKAIYSTAYYKVASDIDMTGSNWTPIGVKATTPFKGHFDGNGKTISNLKMTGLTDFAGLFGYTDGASIKNIILKDITIKGSLAGGIVGSLNNSVLSHNFVYGVINISGDKSSYLGRIYGYSLNSQATENYGAGNTYGGNVSLTGKDGLTLIKKEISNTFELKETLNGNNKHAYYYVDGTFPSLSITFSTNKPDNTLTIFCLNNTIINKVTFDAPQGYIKQRGFLNSGSLELTSSTEISPAGIKNTGEITLTRQPNIWADKNNNGAGWETLCLPFDADVYVDNNKANAITQSSKGKFWLREFIENNDPNSVTFASYENAVSEGEYTIKKNTPYIISYPGNTYGASSLEKASITYRGFGNINELVINPQLTHTNSNYTFEGCNHSKNGAKGYILNSTANEFVNSTNASVAPYQAYFLPKGTSASNVQVLRIATGSNQPTDLTDGMVENKSIRTYVADGVVYLTSDKTQTIRIWNAASGMAVREIEVNNETVTISGLPKGIYIIDREKVVVY